VPARELHEGSDLAEHGAALGRARDGDTRVALLPRTAALGTSGMSVLAIASTRTGAVRLVRTASLYTTEDAFWAVWLPAGHRPLVGAEGAGYAVDTRTLRTRQFSFFTGSSGFTAVVIPASRS